MERETILLAGGSQADRRLLVEVLGEGYTYLHAPEGHQAVDMLAKQGEIDLMLLDLSTPTGMGWELLEQLRVYHWLEGIPVIVLSDTHLSREVERAYELGATEHIVRPFDPLLLRRRVRNTLDLYAKQRRLEILVAEQLQRQEKNNDLMVDILSHIVEFRNSESGGHTLRIRCVTQLLLQQLVRRTESYDLSEADCSLIVTAAALHDIGKISIPEQILNKPGELTAAEFEQMKTHTTTGERILRELTGHADEPLIQVAAEICRSHHERYDGRGYPDGLIGEQIPISAQVVALADVYDALTGERCYKRAYDHDAALRMIRAGECGAFNPLLLDCLQEVGPQLRQALAQEGEEPVRRQEAEALAREVIHVQARSRDERMRQLLRFQGERAEFYAGCSGGVQFSYDVRSGLCTVNDRERLWLEEEQVLNLAQVHALFPARQEDLERLREALKATTVRNSSFSLSLRLGREERWAELRAKTLWSGDGCYLGVIGQLDAPQRAMETALAQAALDASGAAVLLRQMEAVFDVVRLVDPVADQVLTLDETGQLRPTG